jgi:hypothetical protein
VQVQHVELVEREQVDHPPDVVQGEERAGQVERQAAPGVPRRVEHPRARQGELSCVAGRRGRGHELQERGQAAGDTDRFHRAHDHLICIDRQRVPFVGGAAARRPDSRRRGQHAEVVAGPELDPDGRSTGSRVAGHRHEAQPGASRDLRAEPLDDRCDGGIGVRDRGARPEQELSAAAVEPQRGRG